MTRPGLYPVYARRRSGLLIPTGEFGVAEEPSASQAFIEFTDNDGVTQTTSNYSFTGLLLGAEGANRYMVAGITNYGASAPVVNSVTIGGVAATKRGTDAVDQNLRVTQWIAAVPTGATGTVAINTAADCLACAVSLFRLENPSSTTPFASSNAINGTGSLSLDLNTPANGGVIAIVGSDSVTDFVWTGVDEDVTLNYRSSQWHGSGHATGVSAATPRTVSVSGTSGTGANTGALATSWTPA